MADPAENEAYDDRQAAHNAGYRKAWSGAPGAWKRKAEALGIAPEISRSSTAIKYEETYESSSYTPDLPALIDTATDRMVEKHGAQYEKTIRSVIADMSKIMEAEIAKERAMLLGRIVGALVKGESSNVTARIHGLLHAIPRLAMAFGFPSLRASARACGVTPTWMQKLRDEWCGNLELAIPPERAKSPGSREKYRQIALGHEAANGKDHWRRKKLTDPNQLNPNLCKPSKSPPPKPRTRPIRPIPSRPSASFPS